MNTSEFKAIMLKVTKNSEDSIPWLAQFDLNEPEIISQFGQEICDDYKKYGELFHRNNVPQLVMFSNIVLDQNRNFIRISVFTNNDDYNLFQTLNQSLFEPARQLLCDRMNLTVSQHIIHDGQIVLSLLEFIQPTYNDYNQYCQ